MKKSTFVSIGLITLGTFIFAIALNAIVLPNHLGEGGITGVNIILHYLFGWDIAILNLVFNLIIIIVGWSLLEKQTTYYTLYAVVMMSVFIKYVHPPAFIPANTILAPIVGGILIGVALGLVILGKGSTAGTDILALIINKYLGLSIPLALAILDCFIVAMMIVAFQVEAIVFALIMIFITNRAMTFIMEGFNPKKGMFIISSAYQAIGKDITERLGRGVTIFDGRGFYTNAEKQILYIAVDQRQLMAAQRIIHEHDPSAFVTIMDIKQVIGEGFTFYLDKEDDLEDINANI